MLIHKVLCLAVLCLGTRSASLPTTATAINVVVNITGLFNNKGTSLTPGSAANFDGRGASIPAAFLPSTPTFEYRGFNFSLPNFNSSANDNLIVDGQTLSIPQGRYALAGFLLAGDDGQIQRNVTVKYSDGSQILGSVLVNGFEGRGVINTPFTFHTSGSVDNSTTSISYVSLVLDPFKEADSLTFATGSNGKLHVFAMSLFTSSSISNGTAAAPNMSKRRHLLAERRAIKSAASNASSGAVPVVQYLRSTNKLNDTDLSIVKTSRRVQLFEVVLHNLPGASSDSDTSTWITTPHTLRIDSSSVQTVFPATVKRLRAGLSARFMVGVVNQARVARGSKGSATAVLLDSAGDEVARSAPFDIVAGLPEFKDGDQSSLLNHESPMWFDNAKLGIFVHWGVYAVPAFSPVGLQYAEWYWWSQHFPTNVSSPTWVHHKETYGVDVVYDDFIQNFTTSKFHAEDLVDLFHDSGAKYFVQVTKHHDGIAIFDTKNTSDRNTVKLGPKRNLLMEIFNASKTKYPEMRRGTYFSLPEWYHPDYVPYGIGNPSAGSVVGHETDGTPIIQSVAWPGGPAHNAYNESEVEPYTGYVKAPTNYIVDIQGPQMRMLMNDYETEILWCDIGGANFTGELSGTWFNDAYNQGRSVVLNDRCGVISYDFSTPEYTKYPNVLEQKWESNAGLDPFSYGYNAQTPPDRYATAQQTITSLVDIVSKNGNFLVDIGPKEDGTVAQEEIDTLVGVGNWLAYAGPGIYDTKYWNFVSQEGDNIRFTTTDDAFYIFSLVYPNSTSGIQITSPVPLMSGDQVFMLGGTGTPVQWTQDTNGTTTLLPTIAEINQAEYAWGFEIRY